MIFYDLAILQATLSHFIIARDEIQHVAKKEVNFFLISKVLFLTNQLPI